MLMKGILGAPLNLISPLACHCIGEVESRYQIADDRRSRVDNNFEGQTSHKIYHYARLVPCIDISILYLNLSYQVLGPAVLVSTGCLSKLSYH